MPTAEQSIPVRAGQPGEVREFDTRTARLVWTDERIYDDRLRSCAAALIALARVIERNPALRDLSGDFLSDFGQAVAVDAAVFTQVWMEPLAYSWIHMACELVENVQGGKPLTAITAAYRASLAATDAGSALAIHLARFKAFLLGMAVLNGEDCGLRSPLQVPLPFAVPGTRWVLEGEGSVCIEGVSHGLLSMTVAGRPMRAAFANEGGSAAASAPRLVRCPVAKHGACEIRLQIAGLNLAGMDELRPALRLPTAYQEQFAEVISQALAIIADASPAVFGLMSNRLRLVALKPAECGDFANASYSELPGATILGATLNKWAMAEQLIHEYHHGRLFVLEDLGPFFPADEPASGARYYSPWRPDPRPLKGLLHALYVFIAQLRHYLGVLPLGPFEPAEFDFFQARIRCIGAQVALGTALLERHGRFSPYGEQIFAQLRQDCRHLRRRAVAAGVTGDGPAVVVREDGVFVREYDSTVAQEIAEHIRVFDSQDQCAGIDVAELFSVHTHVEG